MLSFSRICLVIVLGVFVLVLGPLGCQNACVELADHVCARAAAELAACESPGTAPAVDSTCDHVDAVHASCHGLQTKAVDTSEDERAECRAELDLVLALEKHQKTSTP